MIRHKTNNVQADEEPLLNTPDPMDNNFAKTIRNNPVFNDNPLDQAGAEDVAPELAPEVPPEAAPNLDNANDNDNDGVDNGNDGDGPNLQLGGSLLRPGPPEAVSIPDTYDEHMSSVKISVGTLACDHLGIVAVSGICSAWCQWTAGPCLGSVCQ